MQYVEAQAFFYLVQSPKRRPIALPDVPHKPLVTMCANYLFVFLLLLALAPGTAEAQYCGAINGAEIAIEIDEDILWPISVDDVPRQAWITLYSPNGNPIAPISVYGVANQSGQTVISMRRNVDIPEDYCDTYIDINAISGHTGAGRAIYYEHDYDFVTVEVSHGLLQSQPTYTYRMMYGGGLADGSFFNPPAGTGGDFGDVLIYMDFNRVRVSPDAMWNAPYYIDQAVLGDG